MRKFVKPNVLLINADCRKALSKIKENRASSIIVDGPYSINFLNNKWDNHGGAKGFYKFSKSWGREAFRILKPGGFLLSFCDSRTVHRMTSAFEDIGFRVHRSIFWVYGNGRPPNYDLVKAMKKYNYSEKMQKKWEGYGTDLKPSFEVIVVVQKPLSEKTIIENLKVWGVGAYNINESLVPYASEKDMLTNPFNRGKYIRSNKSGSLGEPVMGRDISQKSYYMPTKREGRWPATIIHDGSQELIDAFNVFGRKKSTKSPSKAKSKGKIIPGARTQGNLPGDDGTAMRFFYCAKPNKKERTFGLETLGYNPHPTVKPIKLMRYLIRLVTPPGGLVIDCFMGSGTTGMAAVVEGNKFIGIEQERKFFRVSKKRILKALRTVKKVSKKTVG